MRDSQLYSSFSLFLAHDALVHRLFFKLVELREPNRVNFASSFFFVAFLFGVFFCLHITTLCMLIHFFDNVFKKTP